MVSEKRYTAGQMWNAMLDLMKRTGHMPFIIQPTGETKPLKIEPCSELDQDWFEPREDK